MVTALVRDAHAVLDTVAGQDLPAEPAEAVGLLALVACQDVEPGGGEGGWRIARRTAPDRIVSVHDPESRHVHKTVHAYRDGFKGHVAVEPETGMKRALGEHFRLVVIDEAHWLNRECFEYFRHLHDDPQTTFALLFVGGAGCYEVLHREPMLDSRLYAHVRFAPLTPKQVLQVIPVYHRIYGGVDPSLITLVNEQCARGNFRTWAKFTQHALRIMERDGRPSLDEEIARNVFVRLGTGHYARPSAA